MMHHTLHELTGIIPSETDCFGIIVKIATYCLRLLDELHSECK